MLKTPSQGEWLAVAGQGSVELWKLDEEPWKLDRADGSPQANAPWRATVNEFPPGKIRLMAFSPDCEYLAVAWQWHGLETIIDVWRMGFDLPPHKEPQSINCGEEEPFFMRFVRQPNPYGTYAAQ